jgi:ribosomal protein L37AE/L43A
MATSATQYESDGDLSNESSNDELIFVKKIKSSPKYQESDLPPNSSESETSQHEHGQIEKQSCPVCASLAIDRSRALHECEDCHAQFDPYNLKTWRGSNKNKMVSARSIGQIIDGKVFYGPVGIQAGGENPGAITPTIMLPQKISMRPRPRLIDYDDVEFDTSKPPSDYFLLNGKRLSEEVAIARVPVREADVLLIKAPKGCGKSVFIKSILKPHQKFEKLTVGKIVTESWNPSVLAIVHRRSLAKAVANEWGLKNYLDESDSEPSHRYVTSIDSLWKLDEKARHYDILVLDECEQIFRHLLSETIDKKREQIFRVLIKLICGAEKVICSDADLTLELTCYLLSKMRRSFESDRVISIVNEWQAKRDIEVYEKKEHLIAELMCAVADGKRIYVPVSLLKLANQLKNLMELSRLPDGTPIRVLLLTGETSEDEQAKAFFDNPNAEVKKYDVLIATSTLSTGVSIDAKWFDEVYGIFDGQVYTYQDCDQAISRVRTCPTVKVWVHKGIQGEYASEKLIRSGPVKRERMTRSLIGLDAEGKMSKQDEQYMDVYARIHWCEQQWKENRTEQFIELKESDGWTVTQIANAAQMLQAGKEFIKIGKDPSGKERYKKILEAPNIDLEEFDRINSKKNLRGNPKLSVTKFWISKTFDLSSPSDLTLGQIEAYYEKNVRDVINNSKLLKATRIDAIERDKREREYSKNTKAFTSFDHKTMKRDIFERAQIASEVKQSEVLKKARLHAESEAVFAKVKALNKPKSRPLRAASKIRNENRNRLKWLVSQEQINNLTKYVAENLETVNLFFGTNFKAPEADESKMKVFNTIMGAMGVAIKKGRTPKGLPAEYFIDYDRVVELVAAKDLSEMI